MIQNRLKTGMEEVLLRSYSYIGQENGVLQENKE